MKTKHHLTLFILLLIISCKNTPVQNKPKSSNSKTKREINSKSKNDQTIPNETVEKRTQPLRKADTKSIASMLPKGYTILDSTFGKLKDGKEIAVYVLDPMNGEENRTLFIAEKKGTKYSKMSSNKELILCKECGGIFGDPYNGITLKGNVLSIFNYGGSAWRWSEKYIFRYQKNDWQLIGATYESYFNAKPCDGEAGLAGRQLEDINFSAAKMQIIHTQDDNCAPEEDYWKKFNKKKLISLSSFPGKASQWPSGKIKDGDGK